MLNTKLLETIQSKQAIIGIVGLGYVGLPLMLRFVESGFNVLGFDIDTTKIEQLNNGQSYIKHIGTDRVASAHQTGRLLATDDFTRVREADALILCVPTPLGTHHEPDLSFVINTINSLTPHLRRGQLLSLESTTYPGTTEEEIRPRIESKGLTIGEDIFLVYSPEREDPGNKKFTTHNIPKIVGGSTPLCLDLGVTLYNQVVEKVVPVSSTQAAEMTKLLENIYRAVNIGLVNELKTVTDRMGINIWEVIDAAATKPFGFTPFYPGPGLGGHCIPIDPFYLTWKAREYGVHTRFIELAGEVNTAMPEWVVNKVMDALNERGKPVKDSKILVLGIAYKKNVDDSRESPAVELMKLLQDKGGIISYSDPHVPVFPKKRRYHFELNSVEINSDILSQMDCVILATAHDAFNYELILENSNLVVDTRGCYREDHENIVKA
ncbi:nucleotide sugar dehydrogenase [Moorena sp. SIO3H5]|uniref:nucleotide sugar dehydrogenase n=1 Tax=Moorena sp. SIO3H5 TaxID=2607834 RepID=UPI0013BD52F4|nr:nucleotide sugar dehydrogenase [Moorena sp. SIO3H5]NEO68923.1 nucleotide sugar dehydrogenase [Moorena sp. SIO3H5]